MTTLNRLFATLLVAGLAAAGVSAASAAPVAGSVSSAGTLCLGSSPTTPTTTCAHQDSSTLTYLDFINGGMSSPPGLTPTPGQPGMLIFLTASGDLLPLIGRTGTINDFMIPGPGGSLATFSPVNPLWTATGADGATYTYALSTLTMIDRSVPDALDVRGSGTLCRNGIDCNLFSFIFTTQEAAGSIRTTFSLSQSGFAAVPEPGSLTLLGLGLAGLAFGARRRRQHQ